MHACMQIVMCVGGALSSKAGARVVQGGNLFVCACMHGAQRPGLASPVSQNVAILLQINGGTATTNVFPE